MEPVFIVSMFVLFFGALGVNDQMISKTKVEEQKAFIMDDATYKCDQIQKLGKIEKPKTYFIETVKPCPKCKPVEKKVPCGDDRKIFPLCTQHLK